MKSSAMYRLCRAFELGDTRSRALPHPLVGDSREDEHAPDDLEPVDRLGEDQEREEHAEERPHVVEDRRPCGAYPVDGREPEDVREEERSDDGVRKAEPDPAREGELLALDLRAG